MPELDVFDVTRIAREAARAQSLPVVVIGVVPGRGGDYAEILVCIDGGGGEACQIEMGIFRSTSEADLRDEIALRLRHHVEGHMPARTSLSPGPLHAL